MKNNHGGNCAIFEYYANVKKYKKENVGANAPTKLRKGCCVICTRMEFRVGVRFEAPPVNKRKDGDTIFIVTLLRCISGLEFTT